MLTYLALGDSYTIGEQIAPEENFPHQLVRLLNKKGLSVNAPVIVAKTGWTTDELQQGIRQATLSPPYSMVTLLIGVNNQYRGRSVDEYARQFSELLLEALAFTGGGRKTVAVLSIPDWGVTPYAAGRDKVKIAAEIDAYNKVAFEICAQQSIHYCWITNSTREAAFDSSLLTSDELHPSGKEYRKWAEKLAAFYLPVLI